MNSSAPGFPSVDCQELAPPLKGCDRSARTDVRAYTNSAGEPIVVSVPEVTFVQAIILLSFQFTQQHEVSLHLASYHH